MKYLVSVQVIKVYNVTVEAESSDEAHDKVAKMQSTEIADLGALQDVSTDHIQVQDEEEDD